MGGNRAVLVRGPPPWVTEWRGGLGGIRGNFLTNHSVIQLLTMYIYILYCTAVVYRTRSMYVCVYVNELGTVAELSRGPTATTALNSEQQQARATATQQ